MRKAVLTIAGLALLIPADLAGARHYCDGGTVFTVPLLPSPVDPTRTAIYIHDRATTPVTGLTGNPLDPSDDTEGTYFYLENGKGDGYNPGGVSPIPQINATGDPPGDPCGSVCDAWFRCYPGPKSDDLLF